MTGRILKAGLSVIRDGAVLLARSRGDRLFQIPGGKIEPGESDVEALAREALEELGVRLDPATATRLGTFRAAAAGRPGVTVEVRLYEAELQGTPRPSGEIAELHWQRPDASAVPCSDVVGKHILPYLAERLRREEGGR